MIDSKAKRLIIPVVHKVDIRMYLQELSEALDCIKEGWISLGLFDSIKG